MKYIKIIILSIVLLTGCYDANEPNDYAYVVALGIDKSETKGQYVISIQFAKPVQISGGESEEGGKGGETLGLVTVEAPTLFSGINMANNIVSKRFQLAHTKLIVISEELAREGISDILYGIVRSDELRPNMYIAVARSKALDYFNAVKPEMEINPVKYYQLILQNKAAEFIPKTVSQEVYFYINSPEKEIVLPIVSENKSSEGEDEKKPSEGGEKNELPKLEGKENREDFEYLLNKYISGDIIAGKKNKAETMGMAIFHDDKLVCFADNIEAELYNILTGKFQYSYTNFKLENENTTMILRQYRKPSVTVDTKDDIPRIDINLKFDAEMLYVPDSIDAEKNLYKFEKEMSNILKEATDKFLYKLSRETQTDIIGFGSYAKRNYLTYDDFTDYNWKEKFKSAEFNTNVDIELKRAGLMIKRDIK